jgi:tetratricopeptide (TPR) repeat protein
MRMSDRSEEAMRILDRAEPLAIAPGREIEAAQVHYLRGSLYFPLGNVERCVREHERALELARRAGSAELEARALSGLGDAMYAAFKPLSSYRYFEQCIEISRAHGLGKVEVANLAMLGIISVFFLARVEDGLAISLEALKLAMKVGQRRAQVIALQGCAWAWIEMADFVRARPYAEEAVQLAQSIGAKRFVTEGMWYVALCLEQEGRVDESAELLRDAFVLSQEMVTFFGPPILGALAAITADAEERKRCLEEAQRILQLGCPAHNHAFFYRPAIDLSLRLGDWDGAERYAELLQSKFSEESVPWSRSRWNGPARWLPQVVACATPVCWPGWRTLHSRPEMPMPTPGCPNSNARRQRFEPILTHCCAARCDRGDQRVV